MVANADAKVVMIYPLEATVTGGIAAVDHHHHDSSKKKKEEEEEHVSSSVAAATAVEIQQRCLAQMRAGGMTTLERCDLSDVFEDTHPSGELIKEFYDLWAPDYEADMAVMSYKNPMDVAQLLLQLIPDPANQATVTVLDVGAGTGLGGVKLREAGFVQVDATDASPNMLEQAKARHVYRTVLPHEILVAGQPMKTVPPESYDVVTSCGSFFPKYLEGPHLSCFLDCVKTGGWIVISSCPHNDQGLGLRPAIQDLKDQGVLEVVREVYIPKWFRDEDGTVWAFKKLKRLK